MKTPEIAIFSHHNLI